MLKNREPTIKDSEQNSESASLLQDLDRVVRHVQGLSLEHSLPKHVLGLSVGEEALRKVRTEKDAAPFSTQRLPVSKGD